jgi:hypothetical protein
MDGLLLMGGGGGGAIAMGSLNARKSDGFTFFTTLC